MIFDWKENCQRMEAFGSYSADDRWERQQKRRQETCLVHYLISKNGGLARGYGPAFSQWLEFRRRAGEPMDDPDYARIEFGLLVRSYRRLPTACRYSMGTGICRPFAITKGELAYINSLEAPADFRRYVLVLLSLKKYYESMGAKGLELQISPTVRAYAYETANPKGRYSEKSVYLSRYNQSCGRPIRSKMRGSMAVADFPWEEKGAPAADAVTVMKYPIARFYRADLFGLVRPWSARCPRCGSEFRVSGYTKKGLCPRCKAAEKSAKVLAHRKEIKNKS